MKRRSFLTTCAATTGLSFALGATANAKEEDMTYEPVEGLIGGSKLRMSCAPDWFRGASIHEQLKDMQFWGFQGYETLSPPADPAAVRATADACGLEQSCIVGAGGIAPGKMINPAEHDAMVEQFQRNVEIAKVLGCKRLIGLSGNVDETMTHDEMTQNVLSCLERLAPIAQDNDVVIVMEALNTLVDHGGYFLTRTDQTVELLKALNSPNVKMCFDIYHQQITEGNVIRNLSENIDWIGHFHVGDNPGRQEPGTGELNYTNIFKAIAATDYDGFVRLECGNSKNPVRALHRVAACLPR